MAKWLAPTIALLVVMAPFSLLAATFNILGVAEAVNNLGDRDVFRGDGLFVSESGRTTIVQPSVENSASYSLSADARTGELRFNLDAETSTIGSSAGSSVRIRVEEMLTVSGTGTLTARMRVDAHWAAPDYYNFGATLQFASPGLNTVDLISVGRDTEPALRSVNDLLEISLSFTDAVEQELIFASRLDGDIGSNFGRATMDASNTATFALFASDGLSFTAGVGFLSDPAFVEDPTTPAMIPVPASLPLLLGGIFSIIAFKRRGPL